MIGGLAWQTNSTKNWQQILKVETFPSPDLRGTSKTRQAHSSCRRLQFENWKQQPNSGNETSTIKDTIGTRCTRGYSPVQVPYPQLDLHSHRQT